MTRQKRIGTLKISLLGPVRVALGPTLVTQSDFKVETARALLAYLALDPQTPYTREDLATLFWPDEPTATALRNLRQTLNRLRHAVADKNARLSWRSPGRPCSSTRRAAAGWT